MSKLQKVLLGVFCGGVFLCGIGAGVTFVEFSSITYAGEKILGETDMVTEDFDVEFEPGEEAYWIDTCTRDHSDREEIQYTTQVPVNTVRFRASYNRSRVEPFAGADEEDSQIYIFCNWLADDDVELFMEAKDQVLSELKERKISSFRTMNFEEVEILVNPANRNDVKIRY